MTKQDQLHTKESTIYSYRLVKKISHHYLIEMFLGLLFLLMLLWNLTQNRALPYIICYPAVFVLHNVITMCYRTFAMRESRVIWSYKFGIYWCGLLPEGFTPLNKLIKVQTHIFWVGLFTITAIVPWLGTAQVLNLLFIHIWMLAPRLSILLRTKQYNQEGMIKISPRDTSCYLP